MGKGGRASFIMLGKVRCSAESTKRVLMVVPRNMGVHLLRVHKVPLTLLVSLIRHGNKILKPTRPYKRGCVDFARTEECCLSPRVIGQFSFVRAFGYYRPGSSGTNTLGLTRGCNGIVANKDSSRGASYIKQTCAVLPRPIGARARLVSLVRGGATFGANNICCGGAAGRGVKGMGGLLMCSF